MSKVERFGDIAHNMIGRVENVRLADSSCQDIESWIISKGKTYLSCLERMSVKAIPDVQGLVSTLLNLVEVGMSGANLYHQGSVNKLANHMTDLYRRKNADYGNSFDKSMDKFGLVVAAIRLGDKLSRLRSLNRNKGEANVIDETMYDTFIDLACYAIMTLMWLEDQQKGDEYE